jgi:diaminopimelate decarboxylase
VPAGTIKAVHAPSEILRDGRFGSHDPRELAHRFGTPLFAYDLEVVTKHVDALRAALPPSFDLAYAVKANPNLAILHHLARQGIGADVASGGELRHALRAAFAPDQIVITGPGKRDEELAEAVDAGVRAVTVESRGELGRLARIARARGRRQPVLLRAAVTDAGSRDGGRFLGDAAGGKFGMSADDLYQAGAAAVASPWLEPVGVHAFGASNELDATVLADHVDATVDVARALASDAGFPLRLIDVGGGLGIPYQPGEPSLDVDLLGRRLAATTGRLAADVTTRDARVLLEPGRFLVARSGAYLARVVDRKALDGRTVVILEGGINHVLRSVLVNQENRVRLVARSGRPAARGHEPESAAGITPRGGPVMVAGPLCTGLDVLARVADMPQPEPGDLIAVLDVGAYGATESMPHFLSHPMPPEIALLDGQAWVARPRVEPEAWLANQVATAPPGGAT